MLDKQKMQDGYESQDSATPSSVVDGPDLAEDSAILIRYFAWRCEQLSVGAEVYLR